MKLSEYGGRRRTADLVREAFSKPRYAIKPF